MTSLVCLPFGGSGAAFFHPWSAFAADDLEIVPMRLPGRERLIDVEPYRSVHDAVDAFVDDLGDPGDVVLFGHSVGAVLAYELAHRLPSVRHVFVSGSPGPATERPHEIRASVREDDDAFLAQVQVLSGHVDQALYHPDLRELLLPALRADVTMHENYVPSTTEPLTVPITALRGTGDELVSAADIREWAEFTTAGFDTVELPGAHMYVVDSGAAVMNLIQNTIRSDSVV
ncbi:thioesterase II family protein [Amycolatopsis sp. NPDC102389]|uniref:thioesterase II family protein n=1 Tax=Amycolatopsis sp. NPDC102389 TaxID=3363941 RepID=UPI003821C01E